jgi:hypothetical protein
MKRFAVGTICAALLFAGTIPVVAQDEHRDDKDARQEERHDDVRRDEHARRIDDEHFRAHFGHDHHFAVRHVEVVEGRPRFAYGGYNFEIAQPWPAGWAYTDDCYIDFVDGGYFLFNLRHPGVRIAVTVL